MPQPPAHCHLTWTYCLWALPLMIHKRQNLMAFSWSWTLQARCEWALLWVYPDVRSLSWYAAFEVLERKRYLCVITWFKVRNRSPLMNVLFYTSICRCVDLVKWTAAPSALPHSIALFLLCGHFLILWFWTNQQYATSLIFLRQWVSVMWTNLEKSCILMENI